MVHAVMAGPWEPGRRRRPQESGKGSTAWSWIISFETCPLEGIASGPTTKHGVRMPAFNRRV